MNGDYKLIYDVTQELPPVWFPAFGLVFVAIGLMLWRSREKWPFVGERGPWRSLGARRAFSGFYLGFSILWTTVTTVAMLGGACSARRTLESGQAPVVEGPVEDFEPMGSGGHKFERFRVENVRFEYSDYAMTSGFNRTSTHGGPIREGLQVRIHYKGQPRNATILRLEVQE
jgi:hypothetical protein